MAAQREQAAAATSDDVAGAAGKLMTAVVAAAAVAGSLQWCVGTRVAKARRKHRKNSCCRGSPAHTSTPAAAAHLDSSQPMAHGSKNPRCQHSPRVLLLLVTCAAAAKREPPDIEKLLEAPKMTPHGL